MAQGTRYPTLAFITGGAGEASEGLPPQPYETFCYDSALMQAKIQDFNVIPYTSVLPKALFGRIVPVERVAHAFHHGAVLETIIAGAGAQRSDHRAIATGLGICWGQDASGALIGGWAAEYVEYFAEPIDGATADAQARRWLTKSLDHELQLRGVTQHSAYQFWCNNLNLTQPFGYCLTAMGFLNFEYAEPVQIAL